MVYKSKEICLKKRPQGNITLDDFEIKYTEIPDLDEGQFLVRNVWMAVDPFMRIYMVNGSKITSPTDLHKPINGGCIGQIIESKSNKFDAGEYVRANRGWREYWIGQDIEKEKNLVTKVDPRIAPIQYFLGLLGITGITAYVGLLKIGELRENHDTIFVSSAAGGVGSIACQIAKIKGCYVVGSCGSDTKVRWLSNDLKLDYAFNYKKIGEVNISSELNKVCPNGVDIYFDNVGGKHLEAAINNMNLFGRIVLCGTTSQYNIDGSSIAANTDIRSSRSTYYGPSNLSLAVSHRLKLQGFIWSDHTDIINDFNATMSKWIQDGKIMLKETIFEGLENAPKAFVGLFSGENTGRTLVKISNQNQ